MIRRHAILLVDDALVLARDAGGAALSRALWPSLGLAWVADVAYYTERVEGISALRPLFALLVAGLWGARAVTLGELSARSVKRVLMRDDVALPKRSWTSVVASAVWAGFFALLLALPLVLLARRDPWWALLATPLLALGGVWNARWLADCALGARAPGLLTLLDSAQKLEGQRLRALGAELVLCATTLVLMFNLGAAATAAVALSQDVLGFDLALVRAFLAPSNVFVSLSVLGLAACATDALRATCAALLFAEELEQRKALALRADVDAAVHATRFRQGLFFALFCGLLTNSAHAQEPDESVEAQFDFAADADEATAAEATCDSVCTAARAPDLAISARVGDILARSEFRRFDVAADAARSAEPDWLRGIFVWIDRLARRRTLAPAVPERVQVMLLPSAWVFLAVAFLATALALVARLTERKEAATAAAIPPTFVGENAADEDRAEAWLRRARGLAEARPSEAMRAVFLGTVAALVERGALVAEPYLTNVALERALSDSAFYGLFHSLRCDYEDTAYGERPIASERVLRHIEDVMGVFSMMEQR